MLLFTRDIYSVLGHVENFKKTFLRLREKCTVQVCSIKNLSPMVGDYSSHPAKIFNVKAAEQVKIWS